MANARVRLVRCRLTADQRHDVLPASSLLGGVAPASFIADRSYDVDRSNDADLLVAALAAQLHLVERLFSASGSFAGSQRGTISWVLFFDLYALSGNRGLVA